jgi:hypothetical protein
MSKHDKKGTSGGKSTGKDGRGAGIPIGFTATMPIAPAPGAHEAVPLQPPSGAIPLVTVAPLGGLASIAGQPPLVGQAPLSAVPAPADPRALPDSPINQETQRRLVDLSVERETLTVRLEDAARQRADLESRVSELTATIAELKAGRSGMDQQFADLIAERDRLREENQGLQDEVLRLPAELEAVSKSRAFRIMNATPILAIRKPLSTLLIVGAMGSIASLWDFSNVARTIYMAVGTLVLVVSAIQFLARHD